MRLFQFDCEISNVYQILCDIKWKNQNRCEPESLWYRKKTKQTNSSKAKKSAGRQRGIDRNIEKYEALSPGKSKLIRTKISNKYEGHLNPERHAENRKGKQLKERRPNQKSRGWVENNERKCSWTLNWMAK